MDRKFGIEIEAGGMSRYDVAELLQRNGVACSAEEYNHRVSGAWKVVTDSSVLVDGGSFELVSPPLQGEDGVAEMRKVARLLTEAGARVNRTCGLHVHVEVVDLDAEALKRLVALCIRFERAMDALVPMSRRASRNRFTASNRRALARKREDALRRIEQVTSIDELRRLFSFNRYLKLNLESLSRYGTVEFRQHNGTLNGEKMEAWVALCQSLVSAAKRSRSVGVTNTSNAFGMLLLRVPEKYRPVLAQRRAELAAEEGRTPRRGSSPTRIVGTSTTSGTGGTITDGVVTWAVTAPEQNELVRSAIEAGMNAAREVQS